MRWLTFASRSSERDRVHVAGPQVKLDGRGGVVAGERVQARDVDGRLVVDVDMSLASCCSKSVSIEIREVKREGGLDRGNSSSTCLLGC